MKKRIQMNRKSLLNQIQIKVKVVAMIVVMMLLVSLTLKRKKRKKMMVMKKKKENKVEKMIRPAKNKKIAHLKKIYKLQR